MTPTQHLAKALGALLSLNTLFAGEFINLDFNSPDLQGPLVETWPGGPLEGSVSQLLLGWSVEYGGEVQDLASFAPVGAQWGSPVTVIENAPINGQLPVLGRYSVYFSTPREPLSKGFLISQRGEIPGESKGLQVAAAGYVQAFINGSKIGEIGAVSSQSVLDVSAFSGQEVELSFVVRPGDSAVFDVIGFTSVPEPGTWVLMSIGFAGICWRRRGAATSSNFTK